MVAAVVIVKGEIVRAAVHCCRPIAISSSTCLLVLLIKEGSGGVIGTLIHWIKMSDYLEITAFSQLII